MNEIWLNNLQLKTFTEQDVQDYCLLNNINPDDITELYLHKNELTDISGIKIFKNLNTLSLNNNELTDISVLKNLKKLKYLKISLNKISDISDISDIKHLSKLKKLFLNLTDTKDISVIQYLTKLEYLNIDYLWLKSDQIKYLNSCKNLETLICINGFKDMSIIKKLNKNIDIIK